MVVRVSKDVSLTPGLDAFVDGQGASVRYQTASEVVRAGLRLLQSRRSRQRRAKRPVLEPPVAGAAPRGAS
ncbi:MAG: type II toxin-antitoxin system ParD family antitoxin [Acetobacteraceae bacterium]|nr:type II toxin-antitoxin system ParD family antitoxin [Acetobacteraceae bacterium]